jgi:hypothetical protein
MTATLHTAGQIVYTDLEVGQLVPSEAAVATFARTAKNIALFLAAPFIGLVYAMLLPFVGLGMMAIIGGKALVKNPAALRALIAARKVALFALAPFIGLVYAMLMAQCGQVGFHLQWLQWAHCSRPRQTAVRSPNLAKGPTSSFGRAD